MLSRNCKTMASSQLWATPFASVKFKFKFSLLSSQFSSFLFESIKAFSFIFHLTLLHKSNSFEKKLMALFVSLVCFQFQNRNCFEMLLNLRYAFGKKLCSRFLRRSDTVVNPALNSFEVLNLRFPEINFLTNFQFSIGTFYLYVRIDLVVTIQFDFEHKSEGGQRFLIGLGIVWKNEKKQFRFRFMLEIEWKIKKKIPVPNFFQKYRWIPIPIPGFWNLESLSKINHKTILESLPQVIELRL